MSISMERFGSSGGLLRYDAYKRFESRLTPLALQCRVCNFEPDERMLPIHVCPKCHSSSFEWIARRMNVEPSERAGHRMKFRRPLALRR